MNERFLEALKRLNDKIENLQKDLKQLESNVNSYKKEVTPKKIAEVAREVDKYNIKEGKWFYDGEEIGIDATGPKGEPFTFDDLTPEQIELLTGRDGVDGKDGKDGKRGPQGLPGKEGKQGPQGPQGLPGRNGKDGKDGKDGITPNLKIGRVETSPEYGGALAKLRKGKDGVTYLDLTLPRGPQGFMGFDAKINGQNTLEIVAGDNIKIEQKGKKMIISATGVVPPTPTEDTYFITSDDENFITSNNANFIVKESD